MIYKYILKFLAILLPVLVTSISKAQEPVLKEKKFDIYDCGLGILKLDSAYIHWPENEETISPNLFLRFKVDSNFIEKCKSNLKDSALSKVCKIVLNSVWKKIVYSVDSNFYLGGGGDNIYNSSIEDPEWLAKSNGSIVRIYWSDSDIYRLSKYRRKKGYSINKLDDSDLLVSQLLVIYKDSLHLQALRLKRELTNMIWLNRDSALEVITSKVVAYVATKGKIRNTSAFGDQFYELNKGKKNDERFIIPTFYIDNDAMDKKKIQFLSSQGFNRAGDEFKILSDIGKVIGVSTYLDTTKFNHRRFRLLLDSISIINHHIDNLSNWKLFYYKDLLDNLLQDVTGLVNNEKPIRNKNHWELFNHDIDNYIEYVNGILGSMSYSKTILLKRNSSKNAKPLSLKLPSVSGKQSIYNIDFYIKKYNVSNMFAYFLPASRYGDQNNYSKYSMYPLPNGKNAFYSVLDPLGAVKRLLFVNRLSEKKLKYELQNSSENENSEYRRSGRQFFYSEYDKLYHLTENVVIKR